MHQIGMPGTICLRMTNPQVCKRYGQNVIEYWSGKDERKNERKKERIGRVVVALGQFPATLSFVLCVLHSEWDATRETWRLRLRLLLLPRRRRQTLTTKCSRKKEEEINFSRTLFSAQSSSWQLILVISFKDFEEDLHTKKKILKSVRRRRGGYCTYGDKRLLLIRKVWGVLQI